MVTSSKRTFAPRLFAPRVFAPANFRGTGLAPAPVESAKRTFRTRLFNTRLFAPAVFRGASQTPDQAREDALAAAIAEALNGADSGTFSESFTAERGHLVRFDTRKLATLRVSVAPIAKTAKPVARGVWNEQHTIAIEIQKKLDHADQAEQLDSLAELAGQVESFIHSDQLRRIAGGALVDVERNPIADPEAMAQRAYRAVIRLTYSLDLEAEETTAEPPAIETDLAGEHALAAAIAATLNGADSGTFPQAFTAERFHLVRFDTADLATLRVSVAPMAKPSRPAARFVWTEQHTIGLAIQKKLDATTPQKQLEQIDGLKVLAESIEDYLCADGLDMLAGGCLIDVTRDPIADHEALAEREFRAVFRLTYQKDIEAN